MVVILVGRQPSGAADALAVRLLHRKRVRLHEEGVYQMIEREAVKQIQHASVAERIHIIELILQSLKQDMNRTVITGKPQFKTFRVRPFNLGTDIHVDRDTMYAERSL